MSFLTPLYLAGAALIALPILLHLLRRDVAPAVPFTAVRLLQRSPVNRSRSHRLRDVLLLVARIAALLLLAGSFARPYVAGAPASGRTTVVAIDRSFSMAAPARFERARALAAAALDEANADRVALVAFDERAEVLSPAGGAADARAALAAVRPGAGATRYAALFDKAAELLSDEARGRLVVVTDLQRSGFDEASAVLPESIDLQLRDAGAVTSNLSVASAAIDRRRVTVMVRNYGGRSRTTELRLAADGRALPPRRLTVPAEDGVEVAVDAPAEVHRLSAELDDDDGYAADNQRFALAESRALPRLLLIAGAAPSGSGFYLSRALLAEAEDGADFDVRSVSGLEFAAAPAEKLRDAAVVMLLSTRGLARTDGEALRRFVAAGGGLFIAAGPDVDASLVSILLGWQPPLSPRDLRNAGVLAATDLQHPVFKPFDAVAANFGQVGFARAWHIDPGDTWRVLARYTNGSTALAERAGTSGRVLLFTSDVDRAWNDFPLHSAFVPFAQELARYLGARPAAVTAFLVADAPAGVAPAPGLVSTGGRTLAINVDPRESSVARLTPAGFQAMVTRGSGDSQPRAVRLAQQTEGQQNYWRYGLMLMLGALVVEAFVGSR